MFSSSVAVLLRRLRLLRRCSGLVRHRFVTRASDRFLRNHSRKREIEHARERAWKDKHQPASQPPTPAHPRHMPSPAFMSFAQTFDWSQQASEGSLFTSPQQVNILHLASSSWKSERRQDGAASFMAANSVCVCMNEARRWRPAAPCKKAAAGAGA